MTEYEKLREKIHDKLQTLYGWVPSGDADQLLSIIAERCVVVDKKPSDIDEEFLSQAIREMLFSFRKHSGDLDYCVNEIRGDFERAGYKPVREIKKE